jgi:hypothetical protein
MFEEPSNCHFLLVPSAKVPDRLLRFATANRKFLDPLLASFGLIRGLYDCADTRKSEVIRDAKRKGEAFCLRSSLTIPIPSAQRCAGEPDRHMPLL